MDPKIPKDNTPYLLRCRCGVVLEQCRCIGPLVEIVSDAPCHHTAAQIAAAQAGRGASLGSVASAPQVSWLPILGGIALVGLAGMMFLGATNMRND